MTVEERQREVAGDAEDLAGTALRRARSSGAARGTGPSSLDTTGQRTVRATEPSGSRVGSTP
jgi:hypothetical protein